jgi:hypothetical protein
MVMGSRTVQDIAPGKNRGYEAIAITGNLKIIPLRTCHVTLYVQ